MSALDKKIDFVAILSVTMANPNGDPLNGNRPRTDYDDLGEISDVCLKRKIRNRMQDLGHKIFVQSNDRCDDGMDSLSERASASLKGIKNRKEYEEKAKALWMDVRAFGQVFAFGDNKGFSASVRGPVSIHQAVSFDPVETVSMQITKSVNGEKKSGKADGEEKQSDRASDTMGTKHFIRYGLYKMKGSINVQLAEKSGFSYEDAQVIKECIRTLFVNDASSARPDGSMEVVKLYWFEHDCAIGQYPSAVVHRSVDAKLKEGIRIPKSLEDYDIIMEPLPGLEPQVIDGM